MSDASIDAAIARLRAAMADVANGNVAAIKALYEHSDDATSFYGWGGYERGWAEVDKRWDWAAQQFRGGTVSYQPLTRVASGDLFYETVIETFVCKVDGKDEPVTWSNRVTHILRRTGGEWRLIHRHANRLEGQYKPAGRLG
jgi:ketosteroid isomerase-like protein